MKIEEQTEQAVEGARGYSIASRFANSLAATNEDPDLRNLVLDEFLPRISLFAENKEACFIKFDDDSILFTNRKTGKLTPFCSYGAFVEWYMIELCRTGEDPKIVGLDLSVFTKALNNPSP